RVAGDPRRLRVVRRLRQRRAPLLGGDEGVPAARDARGAGHGMIRRLLAAIASFFRKKHAAPPVPVPPPPPPKISEIITTEPKSEKRHMPRIVKCGLIQTALAADVSESIETIRNAQRDTTHN